MSFLIAFPYDRLFTTDLESFDLVIFRTDTGPILAGMLRPFFKILRIMLKMAMSCDDGWKPLFDLGECEHADCFDSSDPWC